jgi:hypothetical protein
MRMCFSDTGARYEPPTVLCPDQNGCPAGMYVTGDGAEKGKTY